MESILLPPCPNSCDILDSEQTALIPLSTTEDTDCTNCATLVDSLITDCFDGEGLGVDMENCINVSGDNGVDIVQDELVIVEIQILQMVIVSKCISYSACYTALNLGLLSFAQVNQ